MGTNFCQYHDREGGSGKSDIKYFYECDILESETQDWDSKVTEFAGRL